MQTKDLTPTERDNLAKAIGYLEKIANTLSDMKYDTKFHTPIISDAQVDCLRVMLSSVELLNARIHAATELSDKCKNRTEFEAARERKLVSEGHRRSGAFPVDFFTKSEDAAMNKLADELDKQGGWL